MNAQHLQLHVAHHEIYTKKTVLFIGKNRQRSCIANFEATLSMRSSNASTRRHQCTLSVRFFPFSEATPSCASASANRTTTLPRLTSGMSAETEACWFRWNCWKYRTARRGAAVSKHDLTHARHDPAHCLAPGLFRSLKRGERKRGKLDVVYDYGDGKRIEFSGPEPLGADDLRILQGLVAMAGPGGLVLSPEPQTEAGQQLRLFLEPKWEAVQQDAMVVKGSYRALAREIGYADPDNTRPVRECIERLWKVSIIAQNGRKRQGFRLLSEYASDEQDGKLYVALNPLIARAVMGGAQHVRIDMDEVRALQIRLFCHFRL